jgi:hypothetical protein
MSASKIFISFIPDLYVLLYCSPLLPASRRLSSSASNRIPTPLLVSDPLFTHLTTTVGQAPLVNDHFQSLLPWLVLNKPPTHPLEVGIIVSLHLGKAPDNQLATKSSAARKTAVSPTHGLLVIRY